jgi:hypothetical protein
MLETQIKKLTEAIYELNATLEAIGGVPTATPMETKHIGESVEDVAEEVTPKKPEPPEEEIKPEPLEEEIEGDAEAYTQKSVKDIALVISRKDRSKQSEIKQILKDHGAKTTTQLEGEDIQKVGALFAAMAEGMGL